MAKKATPEYDVTKHVLVPKHSKVSEKETAALFEQYTITPKELPKILANDPAIQHLDVKEGDVIKIIRHNPTVGDVAFYRRVSGV